MKQNGADDDDKTLNGQSKTEKMEVDPNKVEAEDMKVDPNKVVEAEEMEVDPNKVVETKAEEMEVEANEVVKEKTPVQIDEMKKRLHELEEEGQRLEREVNERNKSGYLERIPEDEPVIYLLCSLRGDGTHKWTRKLDAINNFLPRALLDPGMV